MTDHRAKYRTEIQQVSRGLFSTLHAVMLSFIACRTRARVLQLDGTPTTSVDEAVKSGSLVVVLE